MRAFLIDAYTRTVSKIDYDDYDGPEELLGGEGRGDFTVGSGPLNAPLRDEHMKDGDDRLADYLYVRDWGHQDGWATDGDIAPIPTTEIKGDPRHWFQIDADRAQPSTFPVPGRGLVTGVTVGGSWCDAEIGFEELKARVTFTRRKLRGYVTRIGFIEGEIWVGPDAPIVMDAQAVAE
jgi:hypothetical protein